MKRLTILGLAALTAGTGTTLAQDYGTPTYSEPQQTSPGFFGLNDATQALGPGQQGRRGRHGRGPKGPGFQGFVLGSGEGGYDLISIHLRPPRRDQGVAPSSQYLDASVSDEMSERRGRFQGMVTVNGRRYGVVNLQRERVGGDEYGDDSSYEPSYDAADQGLAEEGPQRREIARISADLVPLRRRRPDAGTEVEDNWPGSWMDDAAGEGVEAPTGRIQGVLVAFRPKRRPPPAQYSEDGYQDGAPSQDFSEGRRRRGRRGRGLVFEGQVVTEEVSGQVLARMGPAPHKPGRGRGHGGPSQGEMPYPAMGTPVPEDGGLY